MNIPKDASRRAYFASLFEAAVSAYSGALEEMARCREQYEGSPLLDGSAEPASAVRNITYELIESQVSSDIPSPKVDPSSYSRERARNALAVERLCAQLRRRLPMEEFNNRDERNTYIYGGSVWLVEWDESRGGHRYHGDVRLTCISPEEFIPQPGMTELADMDYCFLLQTTTRSELCRRFGVSAEQSRLADLQSEGGKGGADTADAEEDSAAVTLVTAYWKNGAGDVCRFVFSGSLTLEDVEGLYRRKRKRCVRCGKLADLCGCRDEAELFDEDVLGEELPLGRRIPLMKGAGNNLKAAALFGQIPYYLPENFPIILRRNTAAYKNLLGQSDCLVIRSQQQGINKVESRIQQKLMRSGITPMVPEDARITLNNSVFGQVLKLREGERADAYGTLDTTPDISQDVMQAERLYQQAKRIIGITDTFQGESDVYAQSGVAKQLQIAQAAGRLESKRRMKLAAYAELDRMLFRLYLAYADEPRAVSYLDGMGKPQSTSFCRYDFLAYDGRRGGFYYDDDFLFSADKNAPAETDRTGLWQRNLDNLTSGSLGDPRKTATLLRYWQSQEQAHYPFARENVEYFEDLLQKEKDAAANALGMAIQEGAASKGEDTP